MRKEQLLLLVLLAAKFPPATTQAQSHLEYEDSDDECQLKTSIVLHKLENCEKEKIKDDFKRNQLWTDVVQEAIGAMMKKQDESKSQLDQLSNILQKLSIELQRQARMLSVLGVTKNHFVLTLGRVFHFNASHMNWIAAKEYCEQRGMQMPLLKTANELRNLSEQLKKHGLANHFWVAASDVGRSPGHFEWADGTAVDKSLWSPGQPKSFGVRKETCVLFFAGDATLRDYPCHKTNVFRVCEVP